MACIRKSGPDPGLGFQVKARKTYSVVSSSFGGDPTRNGRLLRRRVNAQGRCRVNVAHIRHAGPDSGLGFQASDCLYWESFTFDFWKKCIDRFDF